MNKLPAGWKIKKLKYIAEITSSKRIYEYEYVDSGIPFYRGKEITALKNKQKIENFIYISEVRYNELKEKYGVPNKGDILITAVGTIGNAYTIEDDNPFYFKDGNLLWIKNIKEYPKFLEYLFENNKKLFLDNSFGSSQHALTISKLENLSFYFPPLDEQKRIASALSKIDAYLENTIKLIEEKERFKRGIAKKLLTCKEGENIPEARFKGFEGEWEIVKLKDMFDNFKEKNNEDKIILASTIDKGVIPNSLTERKIIRKKESLSNYKLVKKGCFVISLMSFQSGFEYSDYEGIISPAYTVLKPKIEMAHYFYKYYFKSFKFIKDLRPYAEGIRHGKQIKFKACKDILVPYPSIEEQEKIGGYLSLLDKEIDNLKKQKELIKEMKRGAMQKLLSGEIRLLE